MESKAAEGCPGDLKLVAHPRAKSKVWKYFGFDTNAEGCILQWKKIYCRICMAQIAYSGNTSNLSYHLEKNHPEEFCEFVKSNTEQMREAFASAFSKLKPDPCASSQPGEPLGAASAACAPAGVSSSSSSNSSSSMCAPLGAACTQATASPSSSSSSSSSSAKETKRHQELTAAVLSLLCDGLYPPSIVDEATFKALLRTAEPRYELPSREYFCNRALPEKYAAVRALVLRELSTAPWCGLSADLWTSPSQNRSYVTLAAHFLSASHPGAALPSPHAPPCALTLVSRCLKTFEVPEDNTAETVTRVLYEAFIEWGIGSKVFGATTDGRKDLVKACALLDIGVHMPCLGHAFHAGIQQAFRLPQLAALLTRCRKLVEYFQQSAVATYLLYDKQKQQHLPPKMLVSNRVARWGSTLAMLQCLRDQQFAVAAVLLDDSNSHHLMLDAAEWATIDALVELLRPFEQVSEMLAASRYPTISMVKPLLHMLLNSTLNIKETDAKEISMAKEVIAKELARTYQETPEIDMFLNVATFLDPRYKRLPFLSAFERQQVENRVVEEAKTLLDHLKDASYAPPEEKPFAAATAPLAPDDAQCVPAKKRALDVTAPAGSVIHNMLAEIFCPTGGVEDQEEWHAQVLEELSNFKSQKVLALGEDPLKWWCDRLALFPLLPKVLQKYWCVAATRVPPRRLFGSSATVLGAKRNRLAPAHVHQQVFLYENGRGAAADAELEDEDEGEWGLDPDQGLALGDPAHGGFLGIRDGGGGGGGGAFL